MRTVPKASSYRNAPLAAAERNHPVEFEETPIRVFQGSAKNVELGQLVFPFREFSVDDDSDITLVRYQKDAEGWNTISQGDYPTIGKAIQAVSFTPEEFGDYVFYLEITAGSFLVTRQVDISAAVRAGQDKVVKAWAPLKPFSDAKFCVDSDLLSGVEYEVDGMGAITISATFGTDLVERVRNFSIYFATQGEKKVSLIVTDSALNESTDSILVRV